MGLGSMGMSVPGMLSGLGASMMPNMLSGIDGVPFMEVPTKVVCLSQVVSPDGLKEENEYEEILEDMREECGKYGEFLKLIEVLVKAWWPGKISFCQSNDFKSLSHCIQ
jgi:hypothetical protein